MTNTKTTKPYSDKIVGTYTQGGLLILEGESGKKYTLGYDYTGLGGSLDEIEIIELIEDHE